MLTTAQQKVKQELEELQINALVYHNEKTVITRKSHSLKKWKFMIISILVLIVACSLLIKGYWTQEQTQLVSYLTKVDDYNEQSEKILNDFLNEKIDNIEQGKAKQVDLISKVTHLKTSTSFHEHQQDLLSVIEHRLDMMTNLEDPKHSEQQLNKYFIELSVKQEFAVESLTKGFEKEKIKYILRENGTIQYWIKSKSYDVGK